MTTKRLPTLAADARHLVYSRYLKRAYPVQVYLPTEYGTGLGGEYPLIVMNDGQDAPRLHLRQKLAEVEGHLPPFVLVTIPALSRMQTYGISHRPDHKGRGSRATEYARFVACELLPFLRAHYDLTPHREEVASLGFSLGGLSAFDIAWQFSEVFGKAGAFSASFWWRRVEQHEGETGDDCRIIHEVVRDSQKRDGLKFFFQVGTHDETEDRNNNGIIDAIDDTLDLIAALNELGYDSEHDIAYHLIANGRHDPYTWRNVLPIFFEWFLHH